MKHKFTFLLPELIPKRNDPIVRVEMCNLVPRLQSHLRACRVNGNGAYTLPVV